jgi:hypothetical protein
VPPFTESGTSSSFCDFAGRKLVQFSVKASVALEGKFHIWEATITFPSTDVTTGVTDIKIQAARTSLARLQMVAVVKGTTPRAV